MQVKFGLTFLSEIKFFFFGDFRFISKKISSLLTYPPLPTKLSNLLAKHPLPCSNPQESTQDKNREISEIAL